MVRPLTDRDIQTLGELHAAFRNYLDVTGEDWVKPLDLGSCNGSYHSATLQKMAKRGLVEASRKKMRRNARPGIRYRITDAGVALLNSVVSQFEKSSCMGDDVVLAASFAPVNLDLVVAGDGSNGRFNSISDPASGALQLAVQRRLEAERALNSACRGMKYRLYLTLARLYFIKFRLECTSSYFKVRGHIMRFCRQLR